MPAEFAIHDRAVGATNWAELTLQCTHNSLFVMRTTLDIPEDLLGEAQTLLQFKSKTDTVIFSLRELVRRRRLEELKGLFGHIDLAVDIDSSRRRPRRSRRERAA